MGVPGWGKHPGFPGLACPASPWTCPALSPWFSSSPPSARRSPAVGSLSSVPRGVLLARLWLVLVELVTVSDALEGDPEVSAAGGHAYLAKLSEGVHRKAPVDHWARIVRNTSILRKLAYATEALARSALEPLLPELSEPCRTVVTVAILTGLRIGEILALRWKGVDLLRGTMEVAETYSDGRFGSPKTRSSRRILPMSTVLSSALAEHRSKSVFFGERRSGVYDAKGNATQLEESVQPCTRSCM